MIQDLNRFNFDQETNFGILPKSAHSISSGQASIPGTQPRKNVFDADYTVVDAKRAPQNCVDLIEKRFIKLNRILKNKFKDQA